MKFQLDYESDSGVFFFKSAFRIWMELQINIAKNY